VFPLDFLQKPLSVEERPFSVQSFYSRGKSVTTIFFIQLWFYTIFYSIINDIFFTCISLGSYFLIIFSLCSLLIYLIASWSERFLFKISWNQATRTRLYELIKKKKKKGEKKRIQEEKRPPEKLCEEILQMNIK
jgi:hypothetical protein